ncbi:MAG: PD-(D/E)XK nuclease family protein [Polynucleobacter sp.]
MKLESKFIENVLLAKEEFIKLDQVLSRFNIFEATDMGRREVKHTKFLTYLLNPNESHDLGDAFLKNFLLRTVTSLDALHDFPSVLDLDLSFARVDAEFSQFESTGKGKKGTLDCLIRVPYRGSAPAGSPEEIIIAIENKIDASQGQNQLAKYSELLEESFPSKNIYKIYLTIEEEKPDEEAWTNILYKNTVLPAVDLIIENLSDKGSTYIKEILNDYRDLLSENDPQAINADALAIELTQDEKIKSYVEHLKGKDISIDSVGSIYIKHKKALDYLYQFKHDKRSKTLEWWEKALPQIKELPHVNDGENLLFFKESSNRSYLHFNLLSAKNRSELIKYADTPDRIWLKSTRCPINFAIRIVPDSVNNTLKCSAALVLGPIRSNEKREEIYSYLWKLINGEQYMPACNLYWNTLTNMTTGLKPKVHEDPKTWIEEKILKVDDKHQITFQKWVKDISEKLNNGLREFKW